MNIILKITLLSLSIFLLSACTQNKTMVNNEGPLMIYTSIYPIQYATEKIAGELATVKSIYPPGVDSHTYEPTSKEITDIARGDAFIYFGGEMEGFATAVKGALKNQSILLTELGEHEHLFDDADTDGHDTHDHHDHDPHIWLDPLKMIDIGEIITADLTAFYPAHEETFTNNFAKFKADMLALDEAYLRRFNDYKERYIIVTHGAYEYWESRYNIKQIPIHGRSSSDEPSQKDLVEVARLAEEKDINHVLFEQNTDDYVSTIILEHINGEKLYLHNLEVLTEAEIENKEDYITLMKQNLYNLITATNKGAE